MRLVIPITVHVHILFSQAQTYSKRANVGHM